MYPRRPSTSGVYQPASNKKPFRDALRPRTTRPRLPGSWSAAVKDAAGRLPNRPASSSSFASMQSTRPSTRSGLMLELWDEFEEQVLGTVSHARANRLHTVEDVKVVIEGDGGDSSEEEGEHWWEEDVEACCEGLRAERQSLKTSSHVFARVRLRWITIPFKNADFVWDADRLLDWSSLKKLDLTHMIVHGYKETAASRGWLGLNVFQCGAGATGEEDVCVCHPYSSRLFEEMLQDEESLRSIMSQEDAAGPGKRSLQECLERLSGIADRLLDTCIELALSGKRLSEAFDLCVLTCVKLSCNLASWRQRLLNAHKSLVLDEMTRPLRLVDMGHLSPSSVYSIAVFYCLSCFYSREGDFFRAHVATDRCILACRESSDDNGLEDMKLDQKATYMLKEGRGLLGLKGSQESVKAAGK
ncbi:hypothetical protein GUITHDRAFT_116351 [Guillardia theta CCMP2712]|uniref:Uncharacterized protein n=1 Tax=Guillardia theta (strain CCMP2712) TaxID=905079 RepID=L1IMP0_GUITC|nr:hypothetical protein GUITHDRAFT_116351 [Guillardia theta CCMP2712]EKX37543.1 hypothetical protein GUITHDRAFT_116351 [Guillardia theta CCMP2712]|eukprot:XP_005824523.1 hypothetical protein GUITHDRAFT_116351 [Guillardia theta CCMP2712]